MTKREARRIAHREVAKLIDSTDPGTIIGDDDWDSDDGANQGNLEAALGDIMAYHFKHGARR